MYCIFIFPHTTSFPLILILIILHFPSISFISFQHFIFPSQYLIFPQYTSFIFPSQYFISPQYTSFPSSTLFSLHNTSFSLNMLHVHPILHFPSKTSFPLATNFCYLVMASQLVTSALMATASPEIMFSSSLTAFILSFLVVCSLW